MQQRRCDEPVEMPTMLRGWLQPLRKATRRPRLTSEPCGQNAAPRIRRLPFSTPRSRRTSPRQRTVSRRTGLQARCSDVWCCPRCHQVAGQEDFAPNSTFEDQTESLHSSGASSSRRRGPQESGSEQGRLARLERRVAELELERYRRTPLSVQRLVLGVLVFFSRWVRRLRGRPDTRSPL